MLNTFIIDRAFFEETITTLLIQRLYEKTLEA